jgi:hypothetical protein
MNARRPTADLPELVPGVTPVLALLLNRVLGGDSPAYWVNGANRANTTRLRAFAPADCVLDEIEVARGFTAHQHMSLLDRLAGRLEIRESRSVVVATGLDARYRDADVDSDLTEQLFIPVIASVA